LPDKIFLLIYGTANFDKQIADLVNHRLVTTFTDCFQEFVLNEAACIRAESLP